MSETTAESGNDNYAVTAGTSAVVLVEGSGTNQAGNGLPNRGGAAGFPRQCYIHNNHPTQVLYLGFGSDLTTASGFPLQPSEHLVFMLHHTDEMWAIASGASTSARVAVLHGKGNPA